MSLIGGDGAMSRKKRLIHSVAVPLTQDERVLDPLHFEELVVVRESDASDRILFYEMAYKTAHAHMSANKDLTGLPDIGLGPFDDPATYKAHITGDSKARTSVFTVGRTLVMFHMGSAALSDEGRNIFTQRLIELLDRHKPRRLRLYALNRLIRDRYSAAQVERALQALGTVVLTAEGSIDVTKKSDQLMWSILVSFAAAERDGIVERNTLGQIAKARRNEWPFGKPYIPFGYQLVGKHLRADPTMVDKIRQMLIWMADPTLSARQLTDRLGRIGMSRPKTRTVHGDKATVADVLHPKDLRKSLEQWLPLYESGVYRMMLSCPTAEHGQFGGLPVYKDTVDSTKKYVELTYDFGLPESGWADPSVFEAIRQGQQANAPRVARSKASKKHRRLFASRPVYEANGVHYRIDTQSPRGYRLQQVSFRPYSGDEAAAGRRRPRVVVEVVTTIATVDASILHRAVAEGLVSSLSSLTGAPGEVKNNALLPLPGVAEQRADLVRVRMERLESEAARAREFAIRTVDPRAAAKFVEEAELRERELDRARDELAKLSTSDWHGLVEPVVAEGALQKVLTALGRGPIALENEAVDAIRRVIPRLELHPTDVASKLTWLATLSIPLVDGFILEIGPITGEVPTRSARGGKTNACLPAASHRVMERFSKGDSVWTAASTEGYSVNHTRTLISRALASGGFPDELLRRLVFTLVPELRILAGTAALHGIPNRITEEALSDDDIVEVLQDVGALPPGAAPKWATHALHIYLHGGQTTSKAMNHSGGTGLWWLHRNRDFAVALDAVAEGQDTVADIMKALEYRNSQPVMLRRLLTENGPLEPGEPWNVDTRTMRVQSDSRLRLLSCPHCGTSITLYIAVPENQRGLLCSQCRRSPIPDSPVFPESYLRLDDLAVEAAAVPPGVIRGRIVVTEEQEQAAVAEYVAGRPVLEIAEQYGFDAAYLYGLLEKHGVPKRNRSFQRYPQRNTPPDQN